MFVMQSMGLSSAFSAKSIVLFCSHEENIAPYVDESNRRDMQSRSVIFSVVIIGDGIVTPRKLILDMALSLHGRLHDSVSQFQGTDNMVCLCLFVNTLFGTSLGNCLYFHFTIFVILLFPY